MLRVSSAGLVLRPRCVDGQAKRRRFGGRLGHSRRVADWTLQQACEELAVSESTLRAVVRADGIPHCRVGSRIRFEPRHACRVEGRRRHRAGARAARARDRPAAARAHAGDKRTRRPRFALRILGRVDCADHHPRRSLMAARGHQADGTPPKRGWGHGAIRFKSGAWEIAVRPRRGAPQDPWLPAAPLRHFAGARAGAAGCDGRRGPRRHLCVAPARGGLGSADVQGPLGGIRG